MVANDATLRKLCTEQFLVLPYNPEHINPASVDLTLDNTWIDTANLNEIIMGDYITLYPPSTWRELTYKLAKRLYDWGIIKTRPIHKPTAVLARTVEMVCIPIDYAGDVKLKSSSARNGLDHALAGWIDPGFQGTITLELHAHRPVTYKAGDRICQLMLYRMEYVPEKPYNGRYQNQVLPTPARPQKE